MIGQMSESLAGASPGPSVLATIAETIVQTVKLPYVRIETTQGEAALYGTPTKGSPPTRIAINYIDDSVGWLELTPRLPKEPLSLGETTLLNSLARQVGITLHSAQVSEALQASRERLVTAR
jgi:two-component system NarL family sensor kinase